MLATQYGGAPRLVDPAIKHEEQRRRVDADACNSIFRAADARAGRRHGSNVLAFGSDPGPTAQTDGADDDANHATPGKMER